MEKPLCAYQACALARHHGPTATRYRNGAGGGVLTAFGSSGFLVSCFHILLQAYKQSVPRDTQSYKCTLLILYTFKHCWWEYQVVSDRIRHYFLDFSSNHSSTKLNSDDTEGFSKKPIQTEIRTTRPPRWRQTIIWRFGLYIHLGWLRRPGG